ncbi:MAG TPA: aspartate/glutamate racemase family protein [Chloroflexota bacterium]
MTKKVGVLHTSMVFVNVEPVFKDLFKELLPDVEVIDFVDSGVLAEVNRQGCITPQSVGRMTHMAEAAQDAGVDVIFSACSSLGPAIDTARKVVQVPIVKIDDAMAQQAAEKGKEIGVLATVPTTLEPTSNQIREKAGAMGKEVHIHERLAEGAFQVLMSGDKEKHDRMVLEGAKALAPEVDILVLAQASMSRLAPMLSRETGLEVLTSPRSAVAYLKDFLERMPDETERTEAQQAATV